MNRGVEQMNDKDLARVSRIRKQKAEWVTTGDLSGNMVLQGEGFMISHATAAGLGILAFFRGDDGTDETAIVAGGQYFILNGDYREVYEELAPKGLAACMAFFNENKEDNASSWSN
jgi:hypothetical protein